MTQHLPTPSGAHAPTRQCGLPSWAPIIVRIAAGSVAVTIAAACLASRGYHHLPRLRDGAAYAILGLVVWYGIVAAHEIGHLAGARMVGFRFLSVAIGPLWAYRTSKSVRMTLAASPFPLGGLAMAFPQGDFDLRRRLAIMTMGGPVLTLTVLLGSGILLVGEPSGQAARMALPRSEAALIATVCLSMYLLIESLAPVRFRTGHVSDGLRLLRLLREGPTSRRESALFGLAASLQAGIRPRGWRFAWILQATALSDGTAEEALAHWFAYDQAQERGWVDAAAQHLDRAMQLRHQLPVHHQSVYLLEAAFYTASFRSNPVEARSMFEQAAEKPTRSTAFQNLSLRAEAAVLSAEAASPSFLP